MKNAFTIAKREMLSFFVSPIAYFVISGFVVLAGYFFFTGLGIFNLVLERYAASPYHPPGETPNLNQFVIEGLFQTMIVILVFTVPLLSMRLIADERKVGTFELLVTSPVTVWEIVFGKFLGLAAILFLMVLGVLVFPLILCAYGNPEVLPIFSGALGLLLCALSFGALAMAVSSFTENQVVAAVSSMVTLLLLYVISSPAETLEGPTGKILQYLSPVMQVQDLLRGVITIKSLVYFATMIVFGLFLSQRALEAYRWR